MTPSRIEELINDPEVLDAVRVFIRKGLTPHSLIEVFKAYAERIKN